MTSTNVDGVTVVTGARSGRRYTIQILGDERTGQIGWTWGACSGWADTYPGDAVGVRRGEIDPGDLRFLTQVLDLFRAGAL